MTVNQASAEFSPSGFSALLATWMTFSLPTTLTANEPEMVKNVKIASFP
jgi:hypothetical protein